MRKYIMAAVQLDTKNDKETNLKAICGFIDEAAAKGAKVVAFPENMDFMGTHEERILAEDVIPGHTTEVLAKKAVEHGIYINCGSVKEKSLDPSDPRPYNANVVINDKGEIIAKYRKLHLFDVTLPDGRAAKESDRNRPGSDIVNVDTPYGNFGLSICYDVRFPELYRIMALSGAQILFIPANFTTPTGKDHWEALLKARAIENGCYVVAAAQYGMKSSGPAFGASMIVDPWGTVVAGAREEACVITAEIDLDYLDRVRGLIPSLQNRRGDMYSIHKTGEA